MVKRRPSHPRRIRRVNNYNNIINYQINVHCRGFCLFPFACLFAFYKIPFVALEDSCRNVVFQVFNKVEQFVQSGRFTGWVDYPLAHNLFIDCFALKNPYPEQAVTVLEKDSVASLKSCVCTEKPKTRCAGNSGGL